MALQCKSCEGTYERAGRDGTLYFHVCPPILAVRVTRDGAARVVPLADVQPTDRIRVQRGALIVDTLVEELAKDDGRLDDTTLPRPNARDERPNPAKVDATQPHPGLEAAAYAVGAGVVQVLA